MKNETKVNVGMDVHKDSVMVAVLPARAFRKIRALNTSEGVRPSHGVPRGPAGVDGSQDARARRPDPIDGVVPTP